MPLGEDMTVDAMHISSILFGFNKVKNYSFYERQQKIILELEKWNLSKGRRDYGLCD